MTNTNLVQNIRSLGGSRAEIAASLLASPLAPEGKPLSDSALGMWFSRREVPYMWRAAALERLGHIKGVAA